MTANVVQLKGTRAPKDARSSMETMLLTIDEVNKWTLPPFQRALHVNEKVRALAETLKGEGGIFPGVITLGQLAGKATLYVVDGQHRIEAFRLSGLPECIADVRLCLFESMADMAEEFVLLNSSIVRMRPDDVLRGLEASLDVLRRIRRECPFVGYDQIRRGDNGPIISMSVVLKAWMGSGFETPIMHGSAITVAREVSSEDADLLIRFLQLSLAAWGRDAAQWRLWGALNLGLCMWLYRRLVLDKVRIGNQRYVVLDQATFKKCLMSVAADADYHDWLLGRSMRDRDRSPAYSRVRAAFAARIAEETGQKPKLPHAAWFANR